MNREQWLTALMHALAPMCEEQLHGSTGNIATWRVSVGFHGGGAKCKTIGQCWSSTASKDGHTEIFISPVLGTAQEVDHVLLHEMVHASLGIKEGHGKAFGRMARGLGLEGKLTATTCGVALRERLNQLTEALGPYPHASLNLAESGRKKQTTRLLKASCPDCGYTVRLTQKWVDKGLPVCPCGECLELN